MLQYQNRTKIANKKGHYEQAQINSWEDPSQIWWCD